MKKKSIALVVALALVVVCIIGGTLAWLTAKTDPVTNTFTTSDINIKLEESKDLNLKMIPGWTITKDPKVTVKAGSEKCYLFVKLEKSDNFDNFMSYEMAKSDDDKEIWTRLETDSQGNNVDGVYFRIVEKADKDQEFAVIANNQVTVSGSVTKKMMNDLTEDKRPTLTVTAYASQYVKNNIGSNDAQKYFTPAEAWTNAQPQHPTR